MSGTDIAYAAARRSGESGVRCALSSYALAMSCPVLIYATPYAVSGTDIRYQVREFKFRMGEGEDQVSSYASRCYALSGTDIRYAGTRHPMPGTDMQYALTRCYALSGTDIRVGERERGRRRKERERGRGREGEEGGEGGEEEWCEGAEEEGCRGEEREERRRERRGRSEERGERREKIRRRRAWEGGSGVRKKEEEARGGR
eukprot:2276816-Rhodomonas_salina.1